MKKICLIIPPSPFLLDEKVFPFLGILKVAAAWEQEECKIDVLDLSGISSFAVPITKYMEENKDLDFIGITATTPQFPTAFNIACFIKNQWNYKLVLGGSHVTLTHTAFKREVSKGIVNGRSFKSVEKIKEIFDVLICGDGEKTLQAILSTEKGIIDADDKNSPFFMDNQDFSTLPNPNRNLISLKDYQYSIDGENATSMISQLGCPFSCNFCSGRNSPYLRKIRSRSIDSVIKEMEDIYLQYSYKGIMFYDDELNINKSMISLMNSITDLSQKHGIEFKLRGFTKAELFTEEQAKAMYRAGFRWLLTGFESGDSRILTNINKNATRDDNTRCVEIAKKAGLKVKALMSIGHAGENPESVENTKKWLLEVQPDDFDCSVITTYPGSPYFDDARLNSKGVYEFTMKKTGDKLYQKELDYTKDVDYYKGIPGEYISHVWTDFMSSQQLVVARDQLEKEIREKLNIPFNPSGQQRVYSYEEDKLLPDWILRSTGIPSKVKSKRKLTIIQ